ncbi:hypothetical protein INR49_009009 [Caranx melampygus]|nr:hypothetical protein INR49_009009 [Caranx melampygus]
MRRPEVGKSKFPASDFNLNAAESKMAAWYISGSRPLQDVSPPAFRRRAKWKTVGSTFSPFHCRARPTLEEVEPVCGRRGLGEVVEAGRGLEERGNDEGKKEKRAKANSQCISLQLRAFICMVESHISELLVQTGRKVRKDKAVNMSRSVGEISAAVQFVPDLRLAMEYANNASNSYSSGDTMSASLANMTINDQHHQENGVQMGHRSPETPK